MTWFFFAAKPLRVQEYMEKKCKCVGEEHRKLKDLRRVALSMENEAFFARKDNQDSQILP